MCSKRKIGNVYWNKTNRSRRNVSLRNNLYVSIFSHKKKKYFNRVSQVRHLCHYCYHISWEYIAKKKGRVNWKHEKHFSDFKYLLCFNLMRIIMKETIKYLRSATRIVDFSREEDLVFAIDDQRSSIIGYVASMCHW